MSDETEQAETAETSIQKDWVQLLTAAQSIIKRWPNAGRALDRLTGGLVGHGKNALVARLHRYRTANLVAEAELAANASARPLPMVYDELVRQRRIDELSIDATRLTGETTSGISDDSEKAADKRTSDRWFQTFHSEAGMADEDVLREAFLRILTGEIQTPGSFSLQTLRVVGAMSQSTAQHFRRAVSVSIRLSSDGQDIHDARVPAVGGKLGMNCLEQDGLPYAVLQNLVENGLIHSELGSFLPYGQPIAHPSDPSTMIQLPVIHQDERWGLIPTRASNRTSGILVEGAAFTSCGRELIGIVDIEPLPKFKDKLVKHLFKLGLEVRPYVSHL